MMRLLAICFLFLAAGAAASFQPLEEVVPTIGKTESDFSNGRKSNRGQKLSAPKAWKTKYRGLPTAKIRPIGAKEETRFDVLGRRIRFINAEGKAVNFGFDVLGRLTSITNAIGDVTQYGFDAAGNVAWRRNAADELTEYGYDALNRLTSITNEGVWEASFNHDPNGNLVEQTSLSAQTLFGYNELNLMTSSTQTVGSVDFVVGNTFDLNGFRTGITYPGGLTVTYNYGADNRLDGITTSYSRNNKTTTFGYDGASRLTGIAYPNGINTTFGYDAKSRVTNIVHGTFVDRKIERNALGFKTTECINAGIKPTVRDTHRSLKTHNAADQLTSERIQTATTNWTTIDYEYNDNGGLETVLPANEASTSYSYDYDNRISEVSGQSSEVSYLYDASGARIGRIAVDGVGDPVISTNYFVIDYVDGLKRPLAETDASGGILRYYVWSGSRLLCHIEANGDTYYYHSDELGSTLALTDESGNVTDQFAYMPYGYATHTGSTETPFQWLAGYGVYYDSDTDLHLTLHRAYSSKMKRFISPDPLGIDGGANVYMWANMNPLYFVDPSGEIAETVWDVASIGIGIYSLQDNVRKGKWGWATLDVVGIAIDGIAAAVPFLPGGVSAGIKAVKSGNNLVDAVNVGMDVANVADKTHDIAKGMDTLADGAKGWEHAVAGSDLHRRVGAEIGDSLNYFDNYIAGANKSTGIRPDLDGGGQLWADITKSGSWQKHVNKYSSGFGDGIPIFYELGVGVVNMDKYYGALGISALNFGAQNLIHGYK